MTIELAGPDTVDEPPPNGGPAFPCRDVQQCRGMTLRDYFAAKAMQGLIAGCGDANGNVDYDEAYVAKNAYRMADAMLRARAGR